jgi:hypothetical protein
MKMLPRLMLPLLLVLAPLLAEDNLKFGQPACAEALLDKQFFVVCYDRDHKVPTWVGYALIVVVAPAEPIRLRAE